MLVCGDKSSFELLMELQQHLWWYVIYKSDPNRSCSTVYIYNRHMFGKCVQITYSNVSNYNMSFRSGDLNHRVAYITDWHMVQRPCYTWQRTASKRNQEGKTPQWLAATVTPYWAGCLSQWITASTCFDFLWHHAVHWQALLVVQKG